LCAGSGRDDFESPVDERAFNHVKNEYFVLDD
jgi:hypothetical protein